MNTSKDSGFITILLPGIAYTVTNFVKLQIGSNHWLQIDYKIFELFYKFAIKVQVIWMIQRSRGCFIGSLKALGYGGK